MPDPSDDDTKATDDTSQADLIADRDKWKALARKHEERAAANAAAAEELEALRESSKSEADKVAERIARLEADNQAVRAEALRSRVAATHGISAAEADLLLTGSDEETLTKQAEAIAARKVDERKAGEVVKGEGGTPKPKSNDMGSFTKSLFKSDA